MCPVLNDNENHISLLEKLVKDYLGFKIKMNLYLTFKALHLISVISWMAGLLYLAKNICLPY